MPALLQGLLTFHGDLLGMALQALDNASPTGIDVPAELLDIRLTCGKEKGS